MSVTTRAMSRTISLRSRSARSAAQRSIRGYGLLRIASPIRRKLKPPSSASISSVVELEAEVAGRDAVAR